MRIYEASAVGVACLLRCCDAFTYLEIDAQGRFIFNGPDDDELFQSFVQTYQDFCQLKDRWRYPQRYRRQS
jgi:hypothetical protein